MGFDACSWLLFAAVLVNQAGRVMIPAIKTSVLVDPDFAPAFEQNVGAMLSGVSLVCLGGKLLGAALTDKIGGWLVLIAVFVMWIVATAVSVFTKDVQVFGGAWRSMVKVQSGQCPSSAPVPPQGTPGGSGRLGTPRESQPSGHPATALGARTS